jgi:PE-PPE domain
MIPTAILPLLTPVEQIPVIGHALADTLDAPLRVLVEAGYDRTRSPGQPTPWNPLYTPNPIALAVSLGFAIPTGLDNGFEVFAGIRPFGTQRPGPYGVGGPDVTYLNPPATTATNEPTAPTIPSLLSSPAHSAASVNPGEPDDGSREVQPADEALYTPSVSNPTTEVPNPEATAADQGFDALNNGVPVDGSATAPLPPANAEVAADASAPAPESMKDPGVTRASRPATEAQDQAPAVKLYTTTNGPQRGSGADSIATTSPTRSVPDATKSSQPQFRQAIGSNAPRPNATPPSADAPASTAPAGFSGGRDATSSGLSDSASNDPDVGRKSTR